MATTSAWLELIAFAGAMGGGALSTLLLVLFVARARRRNGLFTALSLIFVGLTINYAAMMVTAWQTGGLPPVTGALLCARLAIVAGELLLVRRLLKRPWP